MREKRGEKRDDRDRGGRGRETQNCRHFWTRVSKSVNSHRDRGGRGRETQNCRHFWPASGERKGEKREERRGMRGEKGGEKRDERSQ